RIVGWSIDSRQDSTLVVNALDMAIRNRRPKPACRLPVRMLLPDPDARVVESVRSHTPDERRIQVCRPEAKGSVRNGRRRRKITSHERSAEEFLQQYLWRQRCKRRPWKVGVVVLLREVSFRGIDTRPACS
ncbi:hypothetical protein AB0M86_43310, partial [Streptomyces sp. NPDC051639]|uniref:hypothetical protein n=1 Tax=Streptomyces sp. NPDC051639 TaxID=3155671 RepID=UPI0034478236